MPISTLKGLELVECNYYFSSRTQGKLLASAMHYLQQHKQVANQPRFFDVISLTAGALRGDSSGNIE